MNLVAFPWLFFTSKKLGLRAVKIMKFVLEKLGLLKLFEFINIS